MSRFLRDIQRSFKLKLSRVFFDGSSKRELQERIDIHRLFLFTSLHEQKQLLEGKLPDGFTEHLIEQAKRLPFEEQQLHVHQQLRHQLVDIASSIHHCLQQVHDPRPAATALENAWRLHPQCSSSNSWSSWSSGSSNASAAAAAAAGPLVSQSQLSNMLQQKLGYSLSVRPSLITHQEAGLGLFIEGQVLPGALVALFPGLVYHKPVYRRMPGYPRMDVGNPCLTARYDGGVVDSLPWGQGWKADGQCYVPQVPTAPKTKGLIGRMVAASDGPRRPIPETTWVKATTAEAAALEMLEGRHPLALAHFANHPPAGSAPNAVIASFKFKLQGNMESATSTSSSGGSNSSSSSNDGGDSLAGSGSSSSSSSSRSSGEAPWLRAYVPNIDYCEECTPGDLLTHEVSCVGLVAVQPLTPGSEVLFNYRLSPALLGRPAWYVPVDQQEENMRWA